MSRTRILIPLVTFVFMAAWMGSSPVAAQEDAWTTVGSAGTVDEEDLLLVQLGSPVPGAISMRSVLRGTVNVRYNVVAVGGVLGEAGTLQLTARYLDRGDGQRVVVQLKEYGLSTGLTTTLLTLDSDSVAFLPSDQFQVQTVGCSPPFTVLNFAENAYFMDVAISRFFPLPRPPVDPPVNQALALVEPASPGPALGLIKLGRQPCLF